MFRPILIRRLATILLCSAFWLSHSTANAQAGATLRASTPQTIEFPLISILFSLTDSTGRYTTGLSADDVTVIEDGISIEDVEIGEVILGTRQTFVLNTTRGMRGRDEFGLTRYDYLREALLEWWSRPDAATIGLDDLSLVAYDETLVVHSSLSAELASALAAYEPDLQEESASFDVLLQALDYSVDASSHPDTPSVIFFFTPLIRDPEELTLANTIARAKETRTIIYPILVGPPELLEFPQVENLRYLADSTGGEMILFIPPASLTSLADRILSQRVHYELRYISQANTSGFHTVQIRAKTNGEEVYSNPTTYSIDVSPPEVALIRPPDRIVRRTDDPSIQPEAVHPLSETIDVLITFPDGIERPIKASRLFVDGRLAAIDREAPFTSLEWDLTQHKETGTHTLQVTVEDSLGLEGTTVEVPVTVEIILPTSGMATLSPSLGLILTILAVLALGITIGAVVLTIGRRYTSQSSTDDAEARKQRQRPARRKRSKQIGVEAILEPMDPMGISIDLIGTDILLGRDPALSVVRFDDNSMSGLHARLTRLANGRYMIRDQDSIAGTWVNYELVPDSGRILDHGDLIHLGRVAYRFQRRDMEPAREIHVESVTNTVLVDEADKEEPTQ
ncbi:MAG: FHA domain-containing protein [Anaerolineales bacterium]|nr:FHA domain-containing protein [Anaerolineales bacterium]